MGSLAPGSSCQGCILTMLPSTLTAQVKTRCIIWMNWPTPGHIQWLSVPGKLTDTSDPISIIGGRLAPEKSIFLKCTKIPIEIGAFIDA